MAPGAGELAPEDVAGGDLAGLPPAATDSLPAPAAPGGDVVAALPMAEPVLADPLPDGAPEPLLEAAEDAMPADRLSVLRPVPRPARPTADAGAEGFDAEAAAIAAAVAEAMAPVAVEANPASLPAGTSLAQLGSFDTEVEARLEWDRIVARYGALMDGRQRVIEPAESGGNSFVRLRAAGFDSIEDARRFCSVLLSENTQCVPTQTK